MRTYFDDSLPLLVDIVVSRFGAAVATEGTFHRDARGQLAFFSAVELPLAAKSAAQTEALARLAPYARTDRTIADPSDVGAARVLHAPATLNLCVNTLPIRLLDRRTVGADWLLPPEMPENPGPKRFVFMSLKGGVGRSTALSIAAAHFAGRGLRVLVVDLDMEAPGLASMLLDDKTMPRFGVLDALVENSFGVLGKDFLGDLTGPCSLNARGRIDVLPAFGRSSIENPGDVLAKIARAYVEDVAEDGSSVSMRSQVRNLIDDLASADRYDVVLIDARAGLNESSAAPVLGLGGDVLLFGSNEPQTFYGYASLLAHLRRLLPRSRDTVAGWPARISVVQAKAGDESDIRDFSEKWRDLVRRVWIEAPTRAIPTVQVPAEPFNDVPWLDEQQAPADALVEPVDDEFGTPVPIGHDVRFINFDPARSSGTFTAAVYEPAYGAFLGKLDIQFGTKHP